MARPPRWVRWGQAAAGMAIVLFATRFILANWEVVRASPLEWQPRPFLILASLGIVLGTYALLAETWRRVVGAWGTWLPRLTAARVWVLSSMGKYLPGKIWAVAGMATLGKQAGVAPTVAATAAVALQLLAVGTGALVVAVAALGDLERLRPGFAVGLAVVGLVAAGSFGLLIRPRLLNAVLRRVLGPSHELPDAPPTSTLLFGALTNTVAWLAYGLALYCLAHGVLPESRLGLPLAVGAFAASYLAGFLFLLAPGGLGVREGVFVLLTQGTIGPTEALALAAVSRIAMTTADLIAALPFVATERGRG